MRDQVVDWATQSYRIPGPNGPYSLLVFGGSQGARFFADALPPALVLLPEAIRASLFVVQQCREEDLARVEQAYQAAGVRAHLATFFTNLPEEMAKAHLVIGRAGASTVAELTVMGRPAMLVPLPHAVDNDQLQNALRLAESGGAWCIEQKDLTAERLASVIGHLLQTPQALAEAAAAAKRLGQPDAVVRLADLVEELIGSRAEKRVGFSTRCQRGNEVRMQMPGDIGPVHMLGIGGIGMSAIAEILHAKGYTVQGSDQKDSANVRRLRAKGIRVFVGHDPVNLVGARYIVISTAVKPGNPELEAARAKGLPIIRRAEMLAELMRLYATVSVTGTHGKTTTTSLIAHVFNAAGLDPTVITGGIINEWGSNARLGNGDWMIVEADESDGTFIKIPTQIGVVTNIDPEHLDYFKTVENMHREFETFFRNIPFYGLAVACIDHPVVSEMIERLALRRDGRRLLTYGTSAGGRPRAEVGARRRRHRPSSTPISARACTAAPRTIRGWSIPLCGHHNALNALAAIAAASEAGIADDVIRKAIAGFSGVKRRFQLTGTWNGVSVYDDYGHHPVEIAAVLKAARAGARGRVIAVVEPHRYTRVRDLFHEFAACFKDADQVIVTPLYTAGEAPIDGINHAALAEAIRATGHASVASVDSERDVVPMLQRVGQVGRHGGVPGCGQQHGMGARAARLAGARAAARGRGCCDAFPTCCRRLAASTAGAARPARRQRAAVGHHLVSRRRPGAGAVHAGRRGRPRLFPGAAFPPTCPWW